MERQVKTRIKRNELDYAAMKAGLTIQHDCGGFRVVRDATYLFPDGGVCPTATARECMIFIKGFEEGRRTRP
jgi:hypothetical protein